MRVIRTIKTLGWFLSHAGTTEQTREMAEGVHNRRLLNDECQEDRRRTLCPLFFFSTRHRSENYQIVSAKQMTRGCSSHNTELKRGIP